MPHHKVWSLWMFRKLGFFILQVFSKSTAIAYYAPIFTLEKEFLEARAFYDWANLYLFQPAFCRKLHFSATG